VQYNSTYSEVSGGFAEDTFKIWFKDPCKDNTLTAGIGLSDFVYEIDSGAKTFSLGYTTTVATSTCPLTAVCEIFSDSKRDWDLCSAYSQFS